jgi:hypothetical protein
MTFSLVFHTLHLRILCSLPKRYPCVMASDIKKILVLGSGMVAPPCLEYLCRDPKNRITLGITHPIHPPLSPLTHNHQHPAPSPKLKTSQPSSKIYSPSLSMLPLNSTSTHKSHATTSSSLSFPSPTMQPSYNPLSRVARTS